MRPRAHRVSVLSLEGSKRKQLRNEMFSRASRSKVRTFEGKATAAIRSLVEMIANFAFTECPGYAIMVAGKRNNENLYNNFVFISVLQKELTAKRIVAML